MSNTIETTNSQRMRDVTQYSLKRE